MLFSVNADAGVADDKPQLDALGARADHRARAAQRFDFNAHPASGREFDCIAGEIGQNLREPCGVADQTRRRARMGAHGELDALAPRIEFVGRRYAAQHLRQFERGLVEIEFVGLDLGKIEHVVDQRHQRLRGDVDALDMFTLRLRQRTRGKQLGKADDRVQGCADFVTHGGQEVALGPVRALRFGGGRALRRLGVAPLDDLALQPRPGRARHRDCVAQFRDQGQVVEPRADAVLRAALVGGTGAQQHCGGKQCQHAGANPYLATAPQQNQCRRHHQRQQERRVHGHQRTDETECRATHAKRDGEYQRIVAGLRKLQAADDHPGPGCGGQRQSEQGMPLRAAGRGDAIDAAMAHTKHPARQIGRDDQRQPQRQFAGGEFAAKGDCDHQRQCHIGGDAGRRGGEYLPQEVTADQRDLVLAGVVAGRRRVHRNAVRAPTGTPGSR